MAYEDNRIVIGPSSGTPTGGAMSGTSILTGDWVKLSVHRLISFHASWTGTPIGTFIFEATNDADPTSPILGVSSLTLDTTFGAGNPTGVAGNFIFEFPEASWKWLRIKYINTSGTGTLLVGVEAKGGS